MGAGIIFYTNCFTSKALSPSAVLANTTTEQIFAMPGVLTTDFLCTVVKPTAQAGLGIVGWRISSAGNIGITFINNTAGSLTPTAGEVYLFKFNRPEKVITGPDGLSGGNVIFQ